MTDNNHITAKQYWFEIKTICDDAIEAYHEEHEEKAKPAYPDEWVLDRLHETIDGHQWVIYTHYNPQVLTHSENQDAAWDTFEPVQKDSYGELMAFLAYCSMEADVLSRIDMGKVKADEE